jgi:predicted dehydrogenase
MGWSVSVHDNDPVALRRMKDDIYPSRYKSWDNEIELLEVLPAEQNFDVIIVGTPPDTHIAIASMAITKFTPKLVLIEKPLCPPGMDGAEEFLRLAQDNNVKCLVGFNHNLAPSIKYLENCLNQIELAQIERIEINWLESWAGIFAAHPWLDGPSDSYLGFAKRGGGACHEHSHAVALGVHIASFLNLGDLHLMESATQMVRDQNVEYDAQTNMTLATSSGIAIQIAQDVVTEPAIKELKIISNDVELLWSTNMSRGGDFVKFNGVETFFPKTRVDDFQPEIEHIDDILQDKFTNSPILLSKMLRVSELSKKCFEKGIKNEI